MSIEILETVDDVITALGGNRHVAILTTSKPSAISMWRKAESFPPRTYGIMIDALDEVGKVAPRSLWRMMAVEKDPAA